MESYTNPYDAPQAQVEPLPADAGAGVDGEPQPWSTSDVLSLSWSAFKLHWAPLLAILAVGYLIMFFGQMLISLGVGLVIPAAAQSTEYGAAVVAVIVGALGGLVTQAIVLPGWARASLMVARGQTPDIGVLFSSMSLFLPMLVGAAITTALVYLGLILFIIPAVIIGLATSLYAFFVADGNGGIDAFKASLAATKGHKGALFVFYMVLGLINMGGALACGVGLFVSAPVSLIATAIVYTRITGRQAPREWADS